jgi:signal transduction histidine kinase
LPKSTGLGAYHYIGRSDSLNWRTHIFFAIPATVSGMLFDYPRLGGGPIPGWTLLVLAAIVAPIVVIELLSQLLGKSSWQKPRPWIVIGILTVAGLSRGAVFYFLGGAFGLVPADDLVFRMVGGPLYVGAIYMVGNYILLASIDHRRISSTLQEERANLKLSKQGFEAQLSNLRFAQMSRVRELLAPAIWELGKLLKDASLSKDASRAIGALRQLNDEVVRPLSHSMIQKFELPALTKGVSQRSRLGQFVLPSRVTLGSTLPLTAFAPFVAVITYSATSALLGPIDALLAAAVVTTILTLELLFIKRLIGKATVSLPVAVMSSLAVGSLLGATTWVMVSYEFLALPRDIGLQTLVFFIMTMIVFLMLGIAQMQRNQATEELEEAVEDLRLLTSQLRQQVWLSQKTLATELHGSVQAALNASAMRLALIPNPTPEDLDRVRQDIDNAMQRLGASDYLDGQSIEELLEQICDLWEGSCEISYRLDPDASSALADDSAAAYCTLEVIREAINNAIKHGDAKLIEITASLNAEVIELTVTNNGDATQLSTPGLGSSLYQELALDYKLSLGTPTKFWAKIPLSPSEQ